MPATFMKLPVDNYPGAYLLYRSTEAGSGEAN